VAGQKSLPALLTVEEAARVVGVGRTAAYTQARMWRETAGLVGLPNVAVGDQYRVPTEALAAVIGRPVTRIPNAARPRRREVATDGHPHASGVRVPRADPPAPGQAG